MANLEVANVVRSKRAHLKEHIAAGGISVSEVLLADKVHLRTMKVADLLQAVPGLGASKVGRALRALQISPSATLEKLPHRRREELLEWLRARHRTVNF
jgi:hypothetical protein